MDINDWVTVEKTKTTNKKAETPVVQKNKKGDGAVSPHQALKDVNSALMKELMKLKMQDLFTDHRQENDSDKDDETVIDYLIKVTGSNKDLDSIGKHMFNEVGSVFFWHK